VLPQLPFQRETHACACAASWEPFSATSSLLHFFRQRTAGQAGSGSVEVGACSDHAGYQLNSIPNLTNRWENAIPFRHLRQSPFSTSACHWTKIEDALRCTVREGFWFGSNKS